MEKTQIAIRHALGDKGYNDRDTVRIQPGYSEDKAGVQSGYSRGTVRVQQGYSQGTAGVPVGGTVVVGGA